MLHGNLKKSFRLNRTITLCLLGFLVAHLTVPGLKNTVSPWLLGLWGVLLTGYAAINELGRRTIRKVSDYDEKSLEKLGVFIPCLLFLLTSASYLLTGQGFIAMFLMFPMLEAQLFGHYKLSRGLFAVSLILMAVLLPLGYPRQLEAAGAVDLLLLLPFLISVFHYGSFVASLVFNTSNQVMHLQSLAATDALTGLINRRQFNNRLQTEMARARRYNTPLTLALFDIDNFKKLNDFYGHPVGDRILRELGALIAKNVREVDIPARYGGEEFALILPDTRQVEAYDILERLRALIERTVFCLPDNPLTITISVGVAQLDIKNHTAFELVELADMALYEAKNQGKNRVVYGVVPQPKLTMPPLS